MPKHITKKRSTNTRRRPGSKRQGKGNHRFKVRLVLSLVAIAIVVQIAVFIFNQFKTLFTDPAALNLFRWLVITLLILFFGFFITRFLHSFIKQRTMKRTYEASLYYRVTKRPFKEVRHEPGSFYEYEVSKAIESRFPKMVQWINPVFKRKNALNEYAEVDILCFHPTGLYLIECKDYNGYVYGGAKSAIWTVGYLNGGYKKTYEFQNPVIQNGNHIKDLSNHVKAQYHNVVMFSDRTTIDTDIPAIHTMESFERILKDRPEVYNASDLTSLMRDLEQVRADEARDDHIRRLRYNQSKYA